MSAAWLLPVSGARSPPRRRLRLAVGVLLGAAALALDARSHSAPIHVSRTSKLARALIAVEDERFYQHGAIDPVAIGRAVSSTLTVGSVDPGGSTLAQQLAKVLYVDDRASLLGRLRAIGLAFKLERRYSKSQILDMYLSAVYFGHDFYGIRAASRGYFAAPPARLHWSQATLLAGLPQAPLAFDPLRHFARARSRQREVLAQLVETHVRRAAAARRVAAQPLTFTRPLEIMRR
jgi:membrane peptidoglycan carboxypeptidase